LDAKTLTNFKKYDANGERKVSADELDFDNENLIIKGNNLLALHSLKRRYDSMVDLIYIDPPFNTGNDSFNYNDKFSRSAWLTFMRNRLEVAKSLLNDSGNIFIHIDINNSHYLKTICDEIFGEQNFVEEIIWAYGSPSGGRAAGAKPVNIHDYILHYAKDYSSRKQNKMFTPYSEKYINDWFKYEDEGRSYRRRMKGKDGNGKSIWSKQYLDESPGIPLSTVWSDIKQVYADPRAYKENQSHRSELEKSFSGGQKPEALIKRIIEMCTDENDLILDYHLGTGTTAVVSHKMKRRYIGVEQMDYIQNFSVKRLQSSVEGDLKGISESVNWRGGGSFVYCELSKLNQRETMKVQGFLSYRVDAKSLDNNAEAFKAMTLEEQKQILLAVLDKNQLYVNYSEIDDADFAVSETDKALNHKFYQN